MNKILIPDIFHFCFKENDIFDIYKFYCVKSVVEIINPEKIYFHCFDNNNLNDFYIKKLNKKIEIINYDKEKDIIDTHLIFLNILNILKIYGGIYLDFTNLILNNEIFLKLKKYNFFKSNDDKIIGTEQNSFMINKYIEFIQNIINNTNKEKCNFDQKFGIRNINGTFINNYLLHDSDIFYQEESCDFLFKEIFDYSFSHYFYLIKNFNIIIFKDCENNNEFKNLKKLNNYNIFNKTTLYNLIIKYILGYKFFFKNEKCIINKEKFKLINNLDTIYWINLDNSHKRAENMRSILDNIDKNIICERISAIDGNKITNIASQYFYLDIEYNKEYPNYSNKEYAVLLSHLNTIEKFIKLDDSQLLHKVALICEDDLSIDFMEYWNIDIKTLIKNAPIDWEIIMLGYFSLNMKNNGLYNKWNNEFSAISYLINYEIKDKVMKLKKDDLWICNENDLMVSDNYIFSKFNTYVYKYPFFTFPNENDSTFHEDHINYHKIYKNINYLTLENIYEEYI